MPGGFHFGPVGFSGRSGGGSPFCGFFGFVGFAGVGTGGQGLGIRGLFGPVIPDFFRGVAGFWNDVSGFFPTLDGLPLPPIMRGLTFSTTANVCL